MIYDVPYLAPAHAHRILGHWKSPADPKQHEQLSEIKSKTDRVSILLASSPISRHGALLAYQGKYLAYLRYVLPQCWYPEKLLQKSERKSMARIISKSGCAKTTPHAIVYAPLEFAGAGFLHWYTIQGEGQITHFIKHWRTNTDVSKMLRVAVSWAQWQAGTEASILFHVDTPLPHLESRWIPSLRNYLKSIHGSIQLDQSFVPTVERDGDCYIMELAMASDSFSQDDLKILNYCRMYLHITTVLELCDACGERIMRDMFECRRPQWFNPATVTVLQTRPSAHQIRYQWKRFCRMLCTDDLRLGPTWELKEWTVPGSLLRLRREAYIQHGLITMLYIWRNGSYWMTVPYRTSITQVILHQSTSWQPSSTCTPIDVQRISSRRYLITQSYTTTVLKDKATPIIRDFDD